MKEHEFVVSLEYGAGRGGTPTTPVSTGRWI